MKLLRYLFAGLVCLAVLGIGGTIFFDTLDVIIDTLEDLPWWVWLFLNPITFIFAYRVLFDHSDSDPRLLEKKLEPVPVPDLPREEKKAHATGGHSEEPGSLIMEMMRTQDPKELRNLASAMLIAERTKVYPEVVDKDKVICTHVGPVVKGEDDPARVSFKVDFDTGEFEGIPDIRSDISTSLYGVRDRTGSVEWDLPILSYPGKL